VIHLFRIVLALYLGAAVCFVAHPIVERDSLRRAGPILLLAAEIVHAIEILVRSVAIGHIAVASFDDGLSFLAWTLTVIYLALDRGRALSVVGAVIAPLAFLLTLVAYMVASGTGELPETLRSAWLPVHVGLAFLGNAVFALAFATSLVYLFEDKRLKAKRPPRTGGFPSLEKLDRLNHRLLVWGFPFLTLGIVSGAIWAHFAWGQFWSWEARETWSFLTWLLYAALIHGRVSGGWRGRRAATLTIVGFGLLVASFVSANFLFPGRHGGSFGS
jgi:cytochrome c-type biogenesis protein CcsB